jgi:hypothetical protein
VLPVVFCRGEHRRRWIDFRATRHGARQVFHKEVNQRADAGQQAVARGEDQMHDRVV